MDLSQYAELFRAETREHLSTFNQLLLEWERAPDNVAPVGGIFRAVHTIKGMAATMGYARIADLAHRAENLLEPLRGGDRSVPPEVIELLFRAADALEELVETAGTGGDGGDEVASLLEALDEAGRTLEPPGRRDRPRRRISFVAAPAGVGHKVQVVIRADSPLKGARALVVLGRIGELGAVHAVEPAPSAIEHEEFDGRFAFRLETQADPETIERAIRSAGDVERVAVDAEEDAAAVGVEREAAARTRHLRVDLRRLDRLMNLAGELVTIRGRLEHLGRAQQDPTLTEAVEKLSLLTTDIQSEILASRMTPVWQVFDRFPRLVRDLSRQLDKRVAFAVEGKEIEVDRAVLDELGDPLVHLLRNAVDHGIERPDVRKAAGKPAEGRITLSAVRERGTIAITVDDDGRGIDRGQVLTRARELGLLGDDEAAADDQLFRVLARSGFSMAREVSDVSGRGVGVDVVATRVRALGGSVDVRSVPGRGTAFTLRIPVTLAIVRALLARVGTERYALPLTHVAETVEFTPAARTEVEGRDVLHVRDGIVPLVHLREMLGVDGTPPRKRPVIVLRIGERWSGVVVDDMLGQQEVVVKTFDPPRGMLPIFSGATILGDGSPVLILDAGGLV